VGLLIYVIEEVVLLWRYRYGVGGPKEKVGKIKEETREECVDGLMH